MILQPKVSIIVPVFKVGNYISTCIRSIINQTFTNFELLLIDDGSPDLSGKICDEYAATDSRILVFHKTNGGVSSARNLGLVYARGEWVTFVDSDDFLDQNFFENLINPVLSDNEIDFVQAGCTNYFENTEKTSIEQKYDSLTGFDKKYLIENFRGLTVSKLLKLSIIRERHLSFDETLKCGEDMIFTMNYLLYSSKYAFVSEVGYFYRRHSLAATNNIPTNYNRLLDYFRKYKLAYTNLKKTFCIQEVCLRDYQCAKLLVETIFSLYDDPRFSYKVRLGCLKDDFLDSDIQILKLYDGNSIKKWLIGQLILHRINFFNITSEMISTLYRLFKSIRKV